MKNRQNFPLILGLAIPVVMIFVVAATIYLPHLFAHPKTPVLFTYTDYNNPYTYQVVDHTLQPPSLPDYYLKNNSYPAQPPFNLYLYDPTTAQSRTISLVEAKQLNLDVQATSPDGYDINTGGNRAGGFFFSGGDYNSVYLSGHGLNQKINLPGGNSYNHFQFIGWVINAK